MRLRLRGVPQELLGHGEPQQRVGGRRHGEPLRGGHKHGFHTSGQPRHLFRPQQGQAKTQRQGEEQTAS